MTKTLHLEGTSSGEDHDESNNKQFRCLWIVRFYDVNGKEKMVKWSNVITIDILKEKANSESMNDNIIERCMQKW